MYPNFRGYITRGARTLGKLGPPVGQENDKRMECNITQARRWLPELHDDALFCSQQSMVALAQVMLNILADEIHRAHQRCLQDSCCDPNQKIIDLVFEAAANSMKLLKGAYSCLALIKGVGLVAFRDPYGIRWRTLPLPLP